MVCILEEVFEHGRSLSEHRAVILARTGESFDTPSRSGRNGVNFVSENEKGVEIGMRTKVCRGRKFLPLRQRRRQPWLHRIDRRGSVRSRPLNRFRRKCIIQSLHWSSALLVRVSSISASKYSQTYLPSTQSHSISANNISVQMK